MSISSTNTPLDILEIRHQLASALSTLRIAIENLKPSTTGAEDALALHQVALDKLTKLLAAIDSSYPQK